MKRWLSVAVCLCGLAIANCGDSDLPTEPSDPTERLRELIAQTPRADEEAEMAALWMCGELVAPESAYVQIREGLKMVRTQYRDSIPKVTEINFSHPWSQKLIMPYLNSAGMAAYRAGDHRDIDSLTELLNGEVLDTSYVTFPGNLVDPWFIVRIKFPGMLNIDSVGKMYSELSAVQSINHYFGMFDYSNVYPWRLPDGRLTLLFRDAWGDCPSGCIFSHYWYFRIAGDSVEYVGDYLVDYVTPWPDWWDEAKAGYEEFRRFH